MPCRPEAIVDSGIYLYKTIACYTAKLGGGGESNTVRWKAPRHTNLHMLQQLALTAIFPLKEKTTHRYHTAGKIDCDIN